MRERLEAKRREMEYLREAHRKNPALFAPRTFVDDAAVLKEFGIHIPGKERLPAGMLKLWPEDFIVEEVAGDGAVSPVEAPRLAPAGVPDSFPTLFGTLIKCNASTLEAVEDLAAALHIKKERVAYAGIKDKDAITAQRISLRGVSSQALAKIDSPYFFLNDLKGGKGAVERGSIAGNRFTVLVRTENPLSRDDASLPLARALERVHARGFYNYFYLQRFGTPRLSNFHWARHILRGDYREAVVQMLTFPAPRELPFFQEFRQSLKAHLGDWKEVRRLLEPLPVIFTNELKVVEHLAAHPDDFTGALASIPEQITMWVYALTSVLFNEKIAEYVRQGSGLPASLPLPLSFRQKDVEPYRDSLLRLGLYPLPLHHLEPFPFIQIRSRALPTRDRATILKGEVVPEGLALQFSLAKGQYATTFLSHLFNLSSGFPLPAISKNRVDLKRLFHEPPLTEVLARFAPVIRPKGENIFEEAGT